MEPQALIDKQWHTVIQRLQDREGPVELAVDPTWHPDQPQGTRGGHRVRLLAIEPEGDWLVERPYVLDGSGTLEPGMHVVGVAADGQTRMQFNTTVRRIERFQLNADKRIPALRLAPPDQIRSAQRRQFFRVRTAAADLPPIRIAPVLDLPSVIPAERACFQALRDHATGRASTASDESPKPAIGRLLRVRMVDVSGNGLAIQVGTALKDLFTRCPYFWLEVDLPELPQPIRLTAAVARVDQSPADTLRIGLAFHFQHHPAYRQFVTDHFCRFTAELQRRQRQRQR